MKGIIIEELKKDEYKKYELEFKYSTDNYYDVNRKDDLFNIRLDLKKYDGTREKGFTSILLAEHLEDPSLFGLIKNERVIGFLEVDRERWNNRLRITNIILLDGNRNKGFGSLLIDKAKDIAIYEGFRQLILETQTSNYPAICFYIKNGFIITGIDLSCYSNKDILEKNVRLELSYHL